MSLMPLVRLQVWNVGCDYAGPDGRWCWTSRTWQGISRQEALAAARAAGWSVTNRPGRTELRCPAHRNVHSHEGGLIARLVDAGLSEAEAANEAGQGSAIAAGDGPAGPPLTRRRPRPVDAQRDGDTVGPQGRVSPVTGTPPDGERRASESDFTDRPERGATPPPLDASPRSGAAASGGGASKRGQKRRHGRPRASGGTK